MKSPSLTAMGAALLTACASPPEPEVKLIVEEAVVPASELRGRVFLTQLARIDPDNVEIDAGTIAAQVLSLYGREDLVAEAGFREYELNPCPALGNTGDPLDEIVRQAKRASIVMIGESHTRSYTRAYALAAAERLWEIGYRTFAAEGFASNYFDPDGTAPPESPIDNRPAEHFFRTIDGGYTQEATYGRLGRRLKELGYELVAYEHLSPKGTAASGNQTDRINTRDAGQAENLMRAVFRDDPERRTLIYVGYGHNNESVADVEDGEVRWLGNRIKELTGVDPLTINQFECRHEEGPSFLAEPPESGAFDMIISHPVEAFAGGRPAFRRTLGDIPTPIPQELLPDGDGWRVIEARPVDEPDEAVPMDEVAIQRGDDIKLMLPPGTYRVRAIVPDDDSATN